MTLECPEGGRSCMIAGGHRSAGEFARVGEALLIGEVGIPGWVCASIESGEARAGKARREGIGNTSGPKNSAEQGLGEDKCILHMT